MGLSRRLMETVSVAFETLPPVDFLAWFGIAAVPLQPVGLPAGNAVQSTIWRAADVALKDQAKWKIFVRNKILTWISDRLLVPTRPKPVNQDKDNCFHSVHITRSTGHAHQGGPDDLSY